MHYQIVVRAIIVKNKKILLCRGKKNAWYFLPGGHVNFGESIRHALKREFKEELGIPLKHFLFVGVVENFFKWRGHPAHELNVLVKADVNTSKAVALEKHIEFSWAGIKEFRKKNVLPKASKAAVLKWLGDNKIFFVTQSL